MRARSHGHGHFTQAPAARIKSVEENSQDPLGNRCNPCVYLSQNDDAILSELHFRRPHATTPEARHQYQGPGQPVFDPRFHRLAPLSTCPSPPLWQAGPFISGQKIGGICEGKMGFCEEKVKSGGKCWEHIITSPARRDIAGLPQTT